MADQLTYNKGFVTLAGAGPGDEELITLKLQNRLARADVIISDRLVNPEIIRKHAAKDVPVIFAGKKGYNENSTQQNHVTRLIVEQALAGKHVLRLKGGDVSFFSNVLDELTSLHDNGIHFEIIPGVTAASGASAYAGFPLTARGYSQGVQFVAFNPNNELSIEQWRAFAVTSDTLVFYMATKNITALAEKLLGYSKRADTAMALVEQATTEFQKVHITNLARCATDLGHLQFSSPSLVIIGDVVRLRESFNWFSGNKEGSVFRDLP